MATTTRSLRRQVRIPATTLFTFNFSLSLLLITVAECRASELRANPTDSPISLYCGAVSSALDDYSDGCTRSGVSRGMSGERSIAAESSPSILLEVSGDHIRGVM